jgi:hypothetical protein
MTGFFLIFFAIVGIILLAVTFSIKDGKGAKVLSVSGINSLICAVTFIIAIPISRLDSKTNAEYFKAFQQTVDSNRTNQQDLSVLERTEIIEQINKCNRVIAGWKIKGQKWYFNKWYYDPSTQTTPYIK